MFQRTMRYSLPVVTCLVFFSIPIASAQQPAEGQIATHHDDSAHALSKQPIVGDEVVFEEQDGLLVVEAEHFFRQSADDVRAFYITTANSKESAMADGDPQHTDQSRGGAYVESLPDTRRTHADKLIAGENFMNQPGKMAVLDYKVQINTPGRYYIWVRAFSTGGEDNGLHVGLDGQWPDSGQRLQWCKGKHQWFWESKQRTQKVHCGEPHKIFLDIDAAGGHVISFSMREDGFEFDAWLMTTDRDFKRPAEEGPETKLKSGTLPK